MAILKKEEILEKLKKHFGESTDDDSLSFIEDVSDTIDSYETKVKNTTNWEEKYKENDENWRKKYRDRFFSKSPDDDEEEPPLDPQEESTKYTYDKLFKED